MTAYYNVQRKNGKGWMFIITSSGSRPWCGPRDAAIETVNNMRNAKYQRFRIKPVKP